jgi:hypothetical protein
MVCVPEAVLRSRVHPAAVLVYRQHADLPTSDHAYLGLIRPFLSGELFLNHC